MDKLGLRLAVGYTASKILWLKRHEPDRFAALARVLLPHDYLNFHLTGEYRMEFGDASGTGLMDVRTRTWRREALEAVDADLARRLPPLGHSCRPCGTLRISSARRFGLGDRVLVASGGGDNMMAAIGTGNVVPGTSTLSLGTSGTISAFSPRPVTDPDGEIAGFCDSTGSWLPLACTLNASNGEAAVRALFGLDHASLEAAAAGAPAGADGIVFLPFLAGERMPDLPEASGAFLGLTPLNLTPGRLARAVLEGVALNLGYGFRKLRSLGLACTEVRAIGGGAANRTWLGIIADVLGLPVGRPVESEAAAFGAAVQALWNFHLDRGEDVEISELTGRLVRPSGVRIEPDPVRTRIYREMDERFEALTRALRPEFPALKALGEKLGG